MSCKQAIYRNYLNKWAAEHTHVVEPEIRTNPQDYWDAEAIGVLLTANPKFFFYNWSTKTYRMPNGQVWEIASNRETAFFMSKVAIWPSETAWREYDQPMSFNAYFEHF